MKVEDKRGTYHFRDVVIGECFMDENYIYIKISGDGVDCGSANAIYLDDGTVSRFDSDDEVTPINAKVVIE